MSLVVTTDIYLSLQKKEAEDFVAENNFIDTGKKKQDDYGRTYNMFDTSLHEFQLGICF